jgi:hypothetical protein
MKNVSLVLLASSFIWNFSAQASPSQEETNLKWTDTYWSMQSKGCDVTLTANSSGSALVTRAIGTDHGHFTKNCPARRQFVLYVRKGSSFVTTADNQFPAVISWIDDRCYQIMSGIGFDIYCRKPNRSLLR